MRRCNNCSKRCNVKCAVEMPLTQRKTCTFQTSTTQASVMSFAYHAANDRSNTSDKLTTRSRTPNRSNPAFERQHVSAMFHHVIATSHKDNKSHNWRHGNVIAEAAQPQFRIRQSNSNGNMKKITLVKMRDLALNGLVNADPHAPQQQDQRKNAQHHEITTYNVALRHQHILHDHALAFNKSHDFR